MWIFLLLEWYGFDSLDICLIYLFIYPLYCLYFCCNNKQVKVALLQEQCNIQIPNAYGEMAMRIDGLNEHLQMSNSVIDKV